MYLFSSATECAVYERMLGAQPGGYDVFAKPILWGDIICSSLFPAGRALVLSKKDGRRLAEIWNDLNNQEQNHVREQCWKAIRILRSLSIRVMDVGKHNILYSRETGAVTLLDFETAVECPASELVPLEVEMNVIFGEQIMREPMIGG